MDEQAMPTPSRRRGKGRLYGGGASQHARLRTTTAARDSVRVFDGDERRPHLLPDTDRRFRQGIRIRLTKSLRTTPE
eukprot:7268609-Pyramimonas_sp.AAC.3